MSAFRNLYRHGFRARRAAFAPEVALADPARNAQGPDHPCARGGQGKGRAGSVS